MPHARNSTENIDRQMIRDLDRDFGSGGAKCRNGLASGKYPARIVCAIDVY